jgi:hypothetical protein
MLEKVWLHLTTARNGTLPANKTANILKKIFRKISYIHISIEGNKCIISSTEVPDLNSWVIDKLLNSKKFMGVYHPDHPNFKVSKTAERILTPATRFGYFNCVNLNDKDMGQFFIERTNHLLNKMPLYLANKLAEQTARVKIMPEENKYKDLTRTEYIEDLVHNHNTSRKDAETLIDYEFPELLVKNKETPLTPNQIQKIINDKAEELIKTLRFYSPKERKKYLDKIENFDKYIIFGTLFKTKGRDWIVNTIGEVQDWT